MSFKIKEEQAKVAAATTVEEVKQAFTSVASLADEIAKESARLVAEREAEKNRLAEVEKAISTIGGSICFHSIGTNLYEMLISE